MPVNASDLCETSFSRILDAEQLASLAERFVPRAFGIGASIVSAGKPVRQVHIVRKGRVLLHTENEQGERIPLRECKPGDQFGEIALLDEAPSPFSAIALEETVLLSLDRRDFVELLARYPQVGRELLSSLSRQLRASLASLRAQSASSIDERLSQSESQAMKLGRWVATLAGSWIFFVVFGALLTLWVSLGKGISWPIYLPPFDPFPYTLLNLVLTTMAAIQAPIILVVVNGMNQKDRLKARRDIESDARIQMQVASLHAKLDGQKRWIEDQLDLERVARLETELNGLRATIDEQRISIDKLAQLSRKIGTPDDQRVLTAN